VKGGVLDCKSFRVTLSLLKGFVQPPKRLKIIFRGVFRSQARDLHFKQRPDLMEFLERYALGLGLQQEVKRTCNVARGDLLNDGADPGGGGEKTFGS